MKVKVGPYSLEIGEKRKKGEQARKGKGRRQQQQARGCFGKRPKTRKELRKEKRKMRKVAINDSYVQRRTRVLGLGTTEDPAGDKQPEKSTLKQPTEQVQKDAKKSPESEPKKKKKKNKKVEVKEKKNLTIMEEQKMEKEKEEKKRKKLEEEMTVQRLKMMRKENKDEDKVIKQLEKKLHLNKRKKKNTIPKSFAFDGLDFLLEACDSERMKDIAAAPGWGEDASDSDFEDDVGDMKATKGDVKNKEQCKEEDEDFSDMPESDEDVVSDEDDNMENDEDDEDSESTDDDNIGSDEDEDGEDEHVAEPPAKLTKPKKRVRFEDEAAEETKMSEEEEKSEASKGVKRKTSSDDDEQDSASDSETAENSSAWEDIYGRLRDKDGNVIKSSMSAGGAYVPPAKRNLPATPDAKKMEETRKLQQNLRGLLNRMSESNMHSIAVQVEELYREHSQNMMNTLLTGLMLDLVNPVFTPERFIIEHALLVAILHANVGSEIGAHFLQTVAEELDKQWSTDTDNKGARDLDSIILLLCHVYNFGVVHSCLVFDILKKLGERFGEKDLDLILLVLRSVGFCLRKDDAVTLKETILQLQQKAGTITDTEDKSRVRFLLDILSAIKNNNMHKIPNYDPTYVEHLKKLMKQFVRKGCYVSQLKISLADLVKASERGRWWIVGSAWTGMLPGESAESGIQKSKEGEKKVAKEDQKLMELARQQRMNTDARKNIFCIIMSAEDYMDAFEKLLRLGLKNEQERAIIHVILDCCLQEKTSNPYYSFLAQQFCTSDRKYQLTLQFSLWDKLKEMDSISPNQRSNLGHLLTHLFVEKALPLSVLKVIQFAEISKTMVRFLRQIMLGILLHESEDTCKEVFLRASHSSNLRMMREGLKLFMHHFLLKNKSKLGAEEARRLEERVPLAEQAMMRGEGRVQL